MVLHFIKDFQLSKENLLKTEKELFLHVSTYYFKAHHHFFLSVKGSKMFDLMRKDYVFCTESCYHIVFTINLRRFCHYYLCNFDVRDTKMAVLPRKINFNLVSDFFSKSNF